MRLTDLAIRKLPVPERGQKAYFEGEGFGVRVSQGGTRTFVVMHGKDRSLKSIGRYPEISLKDARKAAKAIQTAPATKKSSQSTTEAVRAFLEECEGRLRPATVTNYRLYLDRLTKAKLSDVTKEDVSYSAHAIMAAKVFFNWCIKEGLTDRNPVQHSKIVANHRSRHLSHVEIKKLWSYEAPPFTDHLKLLLLTGQRRSQFTNFEIRGDTLFFPKAVMKGKSDHTIPLLPLARGYAEKLQPFSGWSKSKARLDRELKLPPFRVHDLRRTFSTVMASLRVPIHVVEKILDHRSGAISGVAAIYNQWQYTEESREALAMYEEHIAKIVL
jgi:integrase